MQNASGSDEEQDEESRDQPDDSKNQNVTESEEERKEDAEMIWLFKLCIDSILEGFSPFIF